MENNDENNIFLQQASVYNKLLKSTPNDIIKKYLNDVFHKTNLTDGRFTTIEKTTEEIKDIIKSSENLTLIQMVDSFNNNIYVGRDNFIDNLNSRLKRRSKGKVVIDKYGLIIDYTLHTDGKVEFTRITDLFNHKLSGEGIDETFNELDRTPINTQFWIAFSKTYPVIDTKKGMFIDCAEIAKNSNGKLSIMDVIIELRNVIKTGWATAINTRINAGNIDYIQFVQINDNTQIPILGLFGSVVKYVPIHKSLLNKELSDFELENGFELFSHLETSYNIITLPTGDFGILCNGEMICARKSKLYSDINKVFDIVSIKNRKKVDRFNNWYKYKKLSNPEYKDYFDENEEDIIQEKVIYNSVLIDSENYLYELLVGNMGKTHAISNYEGGSFTLGTDNITTERVMYKPNTLWKDFTTSERFINETENRYYKRQNTIGNIINRLVTQMNIEGMGVTENAAKYANSLVNNINGILKNGDIIEPLNNEQLLNMRVTDVVDLDMKYTFVKSYYSFKNKKISENNNNFKGQVMTSYLEGNDGKKIKPAEIIDKSKFMNNRINEIINNQKNIENVNENYLESILKVKAIKVYEDKINKLKNEFNLDIDKEKLEKEYLTQKMKYDRIINQIQQYENTNTLPIRTKIEIYNLIDEHNKLTGNNIQIQNFKVQVIDLTDDIIEENKEIIENTSNVESKKLLRKTNTNLRKLKKAFKQNLYILSSYENYKTDKQEINLKDTCNTLQAQIKNILDDANINKNEEYICKLNTMKEFINNILDNKHAIGYYKNYSKQLASLSNVIVNCKEYDYFEQRFRHRCA